MANNNAMVKVFESEQFGNVRIVVDGDKYLFCGADVASALGYSNSRKALKDHCKGVTKRDTFTSKGTQSVSYIPEGDVYRLIARSKLPTAEKFELWVFDEVLPTLRKTGTYSLNGEQVTLPHDFESALEMLLKQVRVTKEQAVKIDALTTEVAALSDEKLTWNDPAVFTALVRKYAFTRCGGDWAGAYNKVYKQLQYKHSISLKKRRAADAKKNPDKPEKPLSKYLKEKELPLAISTIIAMCEDSKVAIDDILRDKNLTALAVC